jgi:hypothetical protein
MAGHVRTFKIIAEELTHFIRFNELDVYLYIWDEGNQDEIDFVVKTLKPIKWKAEKNEIYLPEFLEAEQRIVTKNPKELITPDKNFATLSMHFARRKAFELIEKEYDNVVFSRFDTHMNAFRIKAIVSEFPDAVVTPTNEQYGMVSDIFAIVPWKYADNYFFYPRAEDILSRRFNKKMKEWLSVKFYWENAQRDIRLHDENRYCPHMLCMRNFFETNTPYTVVDLPVFLRR